MAKDGYAVDLIDPVERHITTARAAGLNAELGDARRLAAPDASYDVVLLFGPLYHLLERGERDQALTEAKRVLKPGGLLAAAGVNRYASLFEHTSYQHLHTERMLHSISTILERHFHDGQKAFTKMYFHRGEQLLQEVAEAGFERTAVFGIEGPTWAMLKAVEQHTKEPLDIESGLFQSAPTAARLAEPYPELLAASSHLLTVGHRP
ncbi:methyltransferase domain-containing protein [Streptomyces sp. YC504]|uniref:Methyltransferase domain-containing protein n=1 Tax=Streptomyces mesophilus TaxID=1775132 RepID=A0A6G4XF36_9ACTN|nr:methyltransferase domain-containing protein [Streptomyces mesophilus]